MAKIINFESHKLSKVQKLINAIKPKLNHENKEVENLWFELVSNWIEKHNGNFDFTNTFKIKFTHDYSTEEIKLLESDFKIGMTEFHNRADKYVIAIITDMVFLYKEIAEFRVFNSN